MYEILMHIHLWTISACVLLGAYLLGFPKGTSFHKHLGKGYMFLMFFFLFHFLIFGSPSRSPVFKPFRMDSHFISSNYGDSSCQHICSEKWKHQAPSTHYGIALFHRTPCRRRIYPIPRTLPA